MSGVVVVVGASLAGLSAARSLRERHWDGRVVVVGDEAHAPYDRPPLSKDFLAGTASPEDIALGSPDDEGLDIEWRLGTRASGPSRTAARYVGRRRTPHRRPSRVLASGEPGSGRRRVREDGASRAAGP